jgi:hypothetical protein
MPALPTHAFQHAAFRGRIGLAREDITPPLGIYARNWGAARQDTGDSVHRPLTLTALTISPTIGDQRLVLIDTDIGWWKTMTASRTVQARLLQELSLNSADLIFALSHTHSGPPLLLEANDPTMHGSDLIPPWVETVYQAAVRAVRNAWKSQFDAILDWEYGRCSLAADRDFRDPDPERTRY